MALAVFSERPDALHWLHHLASILPQADIQAGGFAVASSAQTPAVEDQSDAQLVAQAVQGNSRAFERLVRRHYDLIHRIAWRQSGERSDAEDITQNVLMQLVEHLASWRGEGRFTSWLIGITINASRDHRRRHSSFGRMREAFSVLLGKGEPIAADVDPLRQSWLSSVLARLDPKLRATLILVAGEGLSHAEAATRLGVSANTVAWRMNRIRNQFRDTEAGEIGNER